MSHSSRVVALTGMRHMRTLLLVGAFGALVAENCGGSDVVALQCAADSKYCLDATTNERTCVPADPDHGCSGATCQDCRGQLIAPGQPRSHVTTAACSGENKTCSVNTCDDGWSDCNKRNDDACESDLNNGTRISNELVQDCGHCGQICSGLDAVVAHGTTICQVGACRYSCDQGWADCDGVFPGDGCECALETHACAGGTCIPNLPDGG
jgi:hypothetical protein